MATTGGLRVHSLEPIVLASGYSPGWEPIIEGFAALADSRDRSDRSGEETANPGLVFIRFRNPPTGALRDIAIEAPRVVVAIKAHDGH